MQNLNSVLITGGTGSFGQSFVRKVLSLKPDIERLVVYSRDELKQHEMQQEFSTKKYPGLRYFIGDIRDNNRTQMAMDGIDTVIHAAALKQVPAGEYNPTEFIKTNIVGSENVIDACLKMGVKKVIALSTDKACSPISLYGATKLCSDRLFIAANNIKGKRNIRFSLVRYGNVFASRGSVVPLFLEQRKTGIIKVTDTQMTRFNITLEQGVEMVLMAVNKGLGGEILVPKIPSYRITDVAEAIGPDCKIEIIGSRGGEKLHEEMIDSTAGSVICDIGDYFAVLPHGDEAVVAKYIKEFGGKIIKGPFVYNSGSNEHFLTVDEIRNYIKDLIKSE